MKWQDYGNTRELRGALPKILDIADSNIFQKFIFSARLSVDFLFDKHRLERSETEDDSGC
jgi:hypothetical protein